MRLQPVGPIAADGADYSLIGHQAVSFRRARVVGWGRPRDLAQPAGLEGDTGAERRDCRAAS